MKCKFEPIAIVGYGCVFPPDSYDTEKFWENIVSGKPGVQEMPESYWKKDLYYDEDKYSEDKTYCKLGAYIKDYKFPKNKKEFQAKKDIIEGLNKSQLMLLDTVIQAVNKGNISIGELDSDDVSMVVGNMLGDYSVSNECLINREKQIEKYLEESSEFAALTKEQKESIKKSLEEETIEKFNNGTTEIKNKRFHSNLCNGVAEILNIKGRRFIVDGACSGSLLAVDNAVKIIHQKKAKICIVSGVLGNMIVTGNVAFAKIGGLSEKGSFPLDVKGSGLVPGEGAGTIIIKTLSDAIKDNNTIFGVLRGTGVASDGKGKSIYAPSSEGQYKAMKKSLENAGVDPLYVDYVETHATGTRVGDIVELNSLKMLFDESERRDKKIIIGSIKSQVGHCFSAAGMANIIKVIESFNRKVLPPTNYFERFADEFEMGGVEFCVNKELKPWEKEENTPKVALVNAFGFGGINANVLVEEYIPEYHKKLLDSYNETLENKEIDVSIVGVGCIDNNATNYEEWSKNTKNKFKYLNRYPLDRYPQEVDDIYNANKDLKASFIEDFKFPCIKFKIPPVILKEIDRAQLLALVASQEAISSYGLEKIIGDKTGVYIGNMLGLETSINTDLRIRHREYLDILNNLDEFKNLDKVTRESILNYITSKVRECIPKVAEDVLPGYMDNIIAGRISNFFDLTSSNAVYDSGNVSFEQALEQGIMSLQLKENDTVLVGGVNGNMSPEFIEILKNLNIDSNSIPAEGAAVFLIKRTEDVKENERVYGRITGIEFNPKKSAERDNIYKISENSLNEDGNNMFYYGGQGAFQLLKACVEINSNNKEYIQINSKSINNTSYQIDVQASDAEVIREAADKAENDNCFKVGADSIESLISKLEFKEVSIDPGFKKCAYRIEIVYDSEDQLENKIRNIKNLLVK
ncbi:hypothetical protein KQI30_08940 [Clostridium bornimense]|uniref:beta-ketoacyl synthase N-terminal-like domain-containing protein n=1 Tax=Clostridium bornimense TaxID=1216932 RepID=UPI001C0F84C6|nr:beta-ketoacyl synthase N-terminal-like domain-containing protein [Clostridium bornimense]MBU5316395.1 hypothetical protein [Clostridium bornimense]